MNIVLLRLGHAFRHALDFRGRAPRAEIVTATVVPQFAVALVALPIHMLLAEDIGRWASMILQWLALIPLPALVARRLHDMGRSARWGFLLLAVAVRTLGLQVLDAVAGYTVRATVESALSYVDWLLFLPATALALLLAVMPSKKETAAPESSETAA